MPENDVLYKKILEERRDSLTPYQALYIYKEILDILFLKHNYRVFMTPDTLEMTCKKLTKFMLSHLDWSFDEWIQWLEEKRKENIK